MAADNKILGQFDLVGLPPAPRGVPQIEVTFDIDANGIVHVSAKDKATGKEQQIRIQASGGLDDAEIDKMVKDAEAHAEEDKKRREAIEAKNQAEALVNATEKQLSEHGDKLEDADKTAIENAITAVKEAMEKEALDAADVKAKSDALMQVSMKLGEILYREAQEAEAANTDGASSSESADSKPEDADIVDADYEDVKDDEENDEKKAAK